MAAHRFLSLILVVSGVLSCATVFAQSCPPGTSPVYRFYRPSVGAHFYTIDEAERNYVIANLPSFIYEGARFCASRPVGGDEARSRWGVVAEICCSTGPLTYSVTIDGVTKKYYVASCTSEDSFEGFAAANSGPKTYVSAATSTCANANFSQPGNITFAAGACYLFDLAKDDDRLVVRVGPVTCPSSATARIRGEDRKAASMAIFPVLNDDGSPVSGEGLEVLPHD